jgi:hypothetical protein
MNALLLLRQAAHRAMVTLLKFSFKLFLHLFFNNVLKRQTLSRTSCPKMQLKKLGHSMMSRVNALLLVHQETHRAMVTLLKFSFELFFHLFLNNVLKRQTLSRTSCLLGS